MAQCMMWLLGWRVESEISLPAKCIVVGHPHTSTWDFPLFVFTVWILQIDMKWVGKQSLFQGPFGWLFRSLGGLPVDRSGGQNTVESVVIEADMVRIRAVFEGVEGRNPHRQTDIRLRSETEAIQSPQNK